MSSPAKTFDWNDWQSTKRHFITALAGFATVAVGEIGLAALGVIQSSGFDWSLLGKAVGGAVVACAYRAIQRWLIELPKVGS